MSEPEGISGEIVPAPPAPDIRYEDDSEVEDVYVWIKWKNGRILECRAKEPDDFQVNNPESMSSMVLRESKGRISAGGLFTPVKRMLPSLRLFFVAHPRHNMQIRTEATAPQICPCPGPLPAGAEITVAVAVRDGDGKGVVTTSYVGSRHNALPALRHLLEPP